LATVLQYPGYAGPQKRRKQQVSAHQTEVHGIMGAAKGADDECGVCGGDGPVEEAGHQKRNGQHYSAVSVYRSRKRNAAQKETKGNGF